MDASIIALIIVGIAIIFFVTEIVPLPVTALGAAFAMAIFGVISFGDAIAGFGHDVPMILLGSLIMGEALLETGAANKFGAGIIKAIGTNQRVFTTVVVIITASLSAFMSNTVLVATMMPVAAAAAAASGGKITKKHTYMAIGIAANMGGSLTLISTSTNLLGQAILLESGAAGMSLFDLTLGSLPRVIFIALFYFTIGQKIQEKVFNFPEPVSENDTTQENTKNVPPHKMWITIAIFALMVTGFVTSIWTLGTVAMVAALLCISFRCISAKEAFRRIDWSSVLLVVGSLGFATGLERSGAGALIAETAIGFLGEDISAFALLVIFTLLAVVMANLMSSTATISILGPIGVFMFISLGYEPRMVIMALVWSINLAFATPIGTPPITITLAGGYRFSDYIKVGGGLVVVCTLLTIVMYPVIFGLF